MHSLLSFFYSALFCLFLSFSSSPFYTSKALQDEKVTRNGHRNGLDISVFADFLLFFFFFFFLYSTLDGDQEKRFCC